jgi:hypothetical protein
MRPAQMPTRRINAAAGALNGVPCSCSKPIVTVRKSIENAGVIHELEAFAVAASQVAVHKLHRLKTRVSRSNHQACNSTSLGAIVSDNPSADDPITRLTQIAMQFNAYGRAADDKQSIAGWQIQVGGIDDHSPVLCARAQWSAQTVLL